MAGFRHYRQLMTWQLADQLESEVLAIVFESTSATDDLRFRAQILEAVTSVPSNIAEGFLRNSAGDFARFLNYSLASLGETELRLQSGIKRRYFTRERCELAFELVRRAHGAILGLKASQLKYQNDQKARPRKNPPQHRPTGTPSSPDAPHHDSPPPGRPKRTKI